MPNVSRPAHRPGHVAGLVVGNPLISATLREFAKQAAVASTACNNEGFTEWGTHLLRDAELAEIRAVRLDADAGTTGGETDDVPQFIAEANQADTNRPCIDYTELQWLEGMLDELEAVHADLTLLGHHCGTLARCGCQCSAQWKKAKSVTNRIRGALGLRQRLGDVGLTAPTT